MSGWNGHEVSYGSNAVNGQLVPELTGMQIYPSQAITPSYQGRGAYAPTIPPPAKVLPASVDPWTTGYNLAGSGSSNSIEAAAAASDPFNPIKSPVIWAIAFLLIGIIGLRHFHWRG